MSQWLPGLGFWLRAHLDLILPFLLSLGMAGWDLKARRIPNCLTLGGALGGLAFQVGRHGLPGLLDGVAGLGLGADPAGGAPLCWGAWGPGTWKLT